MSINNVSSLESIKDSITNGNLSATELKEIALLLSVKLRHKHYTDVDVPDSALEKITDSKSYKRLPKKAMAWKDTSKASEKTSNRGSHLIKAGQIGEDYAKALNLNVNLTRTIAQGHDVGHSAFAHEGEKFIQLAFKKFNLRNLDP